MDVMVCDITQVRESRGADSLALSAVAVLGFLFSN